MKRNDDLLRDMLLAIEAAPPRRPVFSNELGIAGHDDATLAEHALLLIRSNLAEGRDSSGLGVDVVTINRLTPQGHDFLRAIRDDTVWRRTKKVLAPVGGATLDIVLDVAKGIIRGQISGGN